MFWILFFVLLCANFHKGALRLFNQPLENSGTLITANRKKWYLFSLLFCLEGFFQITLKIIIIIE